MASVWQQLWESKVYLLCAYVFLWMFSVGLLFPHITSIANNYFASRINGDAIKCEDTPGEPACHEGSAEAVKWAAWTSFVSNAICAFTLVPLVGWLSDRRGRKPFLVLGQFLTMLPNAWVFLYLRSPGLPLWGMYPLDAIRGCVNPISICLAYTADLITPEARSVVFGLVLAMLSLATIIASVVGYLLGPLWASFFVLVTLAFNVAFTILVLPESLTPAAKERAVSQSLHSKVVGLEGITASLRVVTRSSLLARLAALMAISGMIFECLKDVLLLYLMNVLGFRQQEIATLFVVMGVSGLATQTLLLPALLTAIGEKWVLVTALCCSTLEMAGLASASTPWMAYTAILIGAAGSMAFPAISAISSANTHPDEQGAVQGALYGMRGLAQGIGPLVFSAVYGWSVQDAHYMPSVPLIGATLLMAGGAAIAFSIRVPAASAGLDGVVSGVLEMLESEYLLHQPTQTSSSESPTESPSSSTKALPVLKASDAAKHSRKDSLSMDRRADSFGLRRNASICEERL